jgi:hypothetical protein
MKLARVINTVTSVILLALGGYHFSTVSPTNPAWRSGTTEVTSAGLLLAAAYLLPRTVSAVVNGVLAVAIAALGVYHFTHAGMGSGVTEWFLAAGLGIAAVSFFKHRR